MKKFSCIFFFKQLKILTKVWRIFIKKNDFTEFEICEVTLTKNGFFTWLY